MSTYKTYKHTERAVARRLGGERTGHLGGADVQVDGWLVVEVKTRKRLPAWLRDAVDQARRNAGLSQLPVVVLHETGTRHADDLVVLTLSDFEAWHGDV